MTVSAPEGAWLVQTSTGLWTEEGQRVADLPGEMRWAPQKTLPDLYWIAPDESSFFLYSDDGVYAGERAGSTLTIRRVADDAVLVRPIGAVAVAMTRGEGGTESRLIDLQGDVLLRDLWLQVRGDQEPPLEHPEYWWSDAYLSRPAAVCEGEGTRRCGYITRTGDWLLPPSPNRRSPMYVDPMRVPVGEGILFSDGRMPLPEAALKTYNGPGAEGLVLMGEEVAHRDVQTTVVDSVGQQVGDVDLSVVWTPGHLCPGALSEQACAYVFHDGLAAVFVAGPTRSPAVRSVYLDARGKLSIDAEPCEGLAPSGPFHEGRAFLCSGAEYWLIDREGTRLAGPYPDWKPDREDRDGYPYGLFFSAGLAAVPTEGGWMYVDREGAVVLPGPYELARPFRHGVAMVKEAGGVRVVDREGKSRF